MHEQAIQFLEKIGQWTLTAIHPNEGKVDTKTFTGPDDTELRPWLDLFGSSHNIYYALNPLRHAVKSKARREDVQSMAWLHVDVDPRPGEDIADEQARALSMLQDPPGDLPKPTAVIFSGGGYQALWKLKEPFEINGKAELYEDAKKYNQQLELIFGADNCHNVDRILRLPGTMNRPNKKKVKKGRKPVMAELVDWNDERVYPLSRFSPAQIVQTEQTGFSAPLVEVSGNVERVQDLDELPDTVPGTCKILIAQGTDPDDPTKHESRSDALFAVCCMLVRAGIEDDTIYSIITDPEWAISESVLDKGSSTQRYALRQIERAREHAIDPNLLMMNEKHAVIRNFGGKPRVIEEVFDEGVDRWRLTKSTFEDITQGYCNIQITVGEDKNGNPVNMPLGKWWINHPSRRTYERITFSPGGSVEPDVFNLWRGFAFEAIPGDKHESFLDHVKDNVCHGDEELYDYVIRWVARAVQKPGEAGQTSLVLRGDQGTGKSFFTDVVGDLFGRHYLSISSADQITGEFNSHLRDCVILGCEEAFYAGDKRHAGKLKAMITQKTVMTTSKGVDSETSRNCLHLIMSSNEDWVVPAGMNERRFCVLDVSDNRRQDSNYFGTIADELKDGGYKNLLHFLLTMDLSKFDVRAVPKTKALQDQKTHSFSPMEEWWHCKLVDGYITSSMNEWPAAVLTRELQDDAADYARKYSIRQKMTPHAIGHFLKKAMPKYERTQLSDVVLYTSPAGKEEELSRPYQYVLPSLQDCRDHWDRNFGGPYDWGPTLRVAASPF